MYTKARIAGHPIHPMLVAFPIALYTGTVVALIVHASTHDPFWYHLAMWANLAGIVMAGVAAVPGFIDLVGIRGHHRPLTTGLRHASFNILALVLFACSTAILWRNYYTGRVLEDTAPLTLAVIGLVSTVIAGWFGWTLVQTHHVGVRPTQYGAAHSLDEIDDLDEIPATPPVTQPSREIPVRH
jgi:uncharacterized membrane protein